MSSIDTLIAQREQLDAQIQQHKAETVATIRNLMTQTGLTVKDLAEPKPAAAKKVQVKYRDAAGNTWTGRGLQPKWLRQALEGGATLGTFLVA